MGKLIANVVSFIAFNFFLNCARDRMYRMNAFLFLTDSTPTEITMNVGILERL